MKNALYLIAGFFMLVSACQKVHKNYVPAASANTIGVQDIDQENAGEIVPKRIKVPLDFPKDVYVYEGGRIVSAYSEEDRAQVEIIATRNPKDLLKEIKMKMSELAWETDKELASVYGDQNKLFLKKGGRNTNYSVSEYEGGKTYLLIEVQNAEE